MPRFVILRHEMQPESERATHWDFMLERDGALDTWALDEAPATGRTIDGLTLARHRLDYLEYEGALSGGRGTVALVDRGDYTLLSDAQDELVVQLDGARFRGVVRVAPLDDDAQRVRVSFSGDSPNTTGGSTG